MKRYKYFAHQRLSLEHYSSLRVISALPTHPHIMQLTIANVGWSFAIIGVLQAWASPLEVDNPPSIVEKRDTSHHLCAGDSSGKAYGVFSCADVTFTGINKIDFSLFARDTKGDSHEVYGFLRVYLLAGYYEDIGKTTDSHGHGKL